jgi:hypothetical protein
VRRLDAGAQRLKGAQTLLVLAAVVVAPPAQDARTRATAAAPRRASGAADRVAAAAAAVVVVLARRGRAGIRKTPITMAPSWTQLLAELQAQLRLKEFAQRNPRRTAITNLALNLAAGTKRIATRGKAIAANLELGELPNF